MMLLVRAIIVLLLLVFDAGPAPAQSKVDYDSFARLPMQLAGRVMPLEHAASMHYSYILDEEAPDAQAAMDWFAQTLFSPVEALQRPIFAVEKPGVRQMLGLEDSSAQLFGFTDLMPRYAGQRQVIMQLLDRPESELSADQQGFIALYQRVVIFGEMLRTLTPILPLNTPVSEKLSKELKLPQGAALSYIDLKQAEPRIIKQVKAVLAKKGDDIDSYSEDEAMLVHLATALPLLEGSGGNNGVLRMVPPQWRDDGDAWASPWQVLRGGKGSPQTAQYLDNWHAMAGRYIAGDAAGFTAASAQALKTVIPMLSAPFAAERLEAELWYDALPIFLVAAWLFAASCFFSVFALRGGRLWSQLAVWGYAFGLNITILGIVWRMFIMWRPPVATLYETMLFAAAILAVCGAFVIRRAQAARLALMGVTAFCAALVLFASQFFQNDANEFKPLIAVLNTPFWLGTHVIMITAGYGTCLLVSMLAHLALVRQAFPRLTARLPDLSVWLHIMALLSLFLVTVGTVLGGVWADQSWGRFWGWDPKENGALLIVLWLVWLLHGKISGHVGTYLWLGGLAGLTIILALAWFGVNLLNTGLHSYGFIDDVALGLAVFCLAQTLVIAILIVIGLQAGKGERHGT